MPFSNVGPSLGYMATLFGAIGAGASILTVVNVAERRSLVRADNMSSTDAITHTELYWAEFSALFAFVGFAILARHEAAAMSLARREAKQYL